MKHKVLVYYHKTKYLQKYKELLDNSGKDLELFICENKKQIEEAIKQAEIIFAGHAFPGELITKAKNLKWIQSMSGGVENYTMSNSLPAGVILTKIKGIFGQAMSEYVLSYILFTTQKMQRVLEYKQKKQWEPFIVDSIRHKTAGIMGLGSVGSYIAYKLHMVGVKVISFDEQEKKLPYVEQEYFYTDREEFLARSDFVILSLPLTSATKGIIGPKELDIMKDTAYLINVSRGHLVQEDALIDALNNNKIAGAILDVFYEEPLPQEHPFWKLDNVIITPHISGPSLPEDIVKLFLNNLERYENGRKLEGLVDFNKGY